MKKDVVRFVEKCLTCQQVKVEHQRPTRTLQPLEIPKWKWEQITMDFVSELPRSPMNHNLIWVIVDRLTKTAHFIPILMTYSMDRLAELYVQHIVRLHGVPKSIVSDRDTRFTSKFWGCLQVAIGTRLKFSSIFHLQTDGQSEKTIQILKDMLRVCLINFSRSWEKYLPLVEFAYNNSFQSTVGMAPYEALYGRKYRLLVYWDEAGERQYLGPDMVDQTTKAIKVIRQRMKTGQSRQKSYADKRRRPLEFEIGSKVFLKISPMKDVTRFRKRGKLNPRFIGPFEILERIGKVSYRLALPPAMSGVHDVFHVSMLRKYVHDPSHILQHPEVEYAPMDREEVRPVRILDARDKQLRNKTIHLVKVQWQGRSTEEATWEREDEVRARYPRLFENTGL